MLLAGTAVPVCAGAGRGSAPLWRVTYIQWWAQGTTLPCSSGLPPQPGDLGYVHLWITALVRLIGSAPRSFHQAPSMLSSFPTLTAHQLALLPHEPHWIRNSSVIAVCQLYSPSYWLELVHALLYLKSPTSSLTSTSRQHTSHQRFWGT